MTHVVTDSCINCKYTNCVEVCPVECFHDGVNIVVIDPEECIDCGACVPECPVEAIFTEDEIPEDQKEFIELNAKFAAEWPIISVTQDAMPGADDFKDQKGKRGLLKEEAGPGS